MTSWAPLTAELTEISFFVVTAVITVVSLQRLALEGWQKRAFPFAIAFSVAVKLGLANLGHNFDVNSYRIVSDLVAHGRSVYANTTRYNYGPVWMWLLSGFGRLAGTSGGEAFHMWVAAFLAAVDVLMAIAIARAYSANAAIVYLLCPIGWMVSGFQSQFDNLAVLAALLAWLLIRSGKPKQSAWITSAALMGLSLVIKHILFLFPIWLVFWRPLGKLRHRVVYAGIAYGLFAVSFVPWLADPASRAGILNNVFRYSSFYGNSLLGLVLPIHSLDLWLRWVPVVSGFKALWMLLIFAAGVAVTRRQTRDAYLFYLLVLFASTPALTDQYVAIPLLAAAVFYKEWQSWAFIAAGTLGILTSYDNIGPVLYHGFPAVPVIAGHAVNLRHRLLNPTNWEVFLVSAQICVVALLVTRWRASTRRATEQASAIHDSKSASAIELLESEAPVS